MIATGLVAFAAAAAAQQAGSWRLLKTANPRGGADAVSIIHTADTARSDLGLAGMMLRCGDVRPEVVIVVVAPFPLRTEPSVTIGGNGREWRFAAHVLPPGAELLLPAEATDLATGAWQSAHELAVHVSSPVQTYSGVISIDGLSAAFSTLVANCPAN